MGLSQDELLLVCALSVYSLLMVFMLLRSRKSAERHLPPSPPGRRPVFGHLHLLQLPLHQTLHKLAQKYGPFFYIKMGSIPAVVVSSPDWAKEILRTHDYDFVDRPQFEISKRLFYNNKTMIMMAYCSTWRDLRKLYTAQILNSRRIEMFENARHDEMVMLMESITQHALLGAGVGLDFKKLIFYTVGNMLTRMLFSKRSFEVAAAVNESDSRFKEMLEEVAVLFGTPVLGDLIPWLNWFDLQGCKKRMDKLAPELDAFFEDVVVQRIASRGASETNEDADSDYLDLLLRNYNTDGKVDRESIKCILLDLLSTGMDTSSTTIEWALAELMRNPDCMKKLQQELDTLVAAKDGAVNMRSKCIRDVDIAKLSYLQAVIKETLRLYPASPIYFRQLRKDIENGIQVRGYDLPKKTRVLLNVWSLGRDTTLWGTNAGTFCPDRFLDSSAPDFRGQHFEFLPFGTGRRGCPGISLALTVVPFIVANLVHVFDLNLPNGAFLDLSEATSLNTPKSLVALPVLRPGSL